MSQCNDNACSTATARSSECCAVEETLRTKAECCPVEKAAELWSASFFAAFREVQRDLLKERIRKAWGAKLEKEADATVQVMGVYWQSVLAQAKAKQDFQAALKRSYEQQ